MVETIATWYGRTGLTGEEKITSAIRFCDSRRGSISVELKRKILFSQRHKCHYCGLDLSRSWYYLDKFGDLKSIGINFDHFIPVAYLANETFENLYAVCSLYNRYKSSKMFNSIEECRQYLAKKIRKLDIKIWSVRDTEDYLTK